MEEKNDMESKIENKKIIISGTTNRYMIKKATKEPKIQKKRIIAEKWNLNKDLFDKECQVSLLKSIKEHDYKSFSKESSHIISEIERKISSYKYQDIEKNILDTSILIDLADIIDALIISELNCYYCKCEMDILYEMVRENKQWTVDRIDNSKGHNKDNYVLSCLSCNLKRRCKSADKFLFTKQLNLIKTE
jgi:hypothetical protein